MKKLIGVIAVLLLCAGFAGAQVSYYNFNVSNGLPSNEVYCVFQDRQGYMWFGTDHGVCCYDGHEFKLFTTVNGLTDNTVFLIKDDEKGNIWCLTYAGGICYYDGKSFKPHPQNDTIMAMYKRNLPSSWSVAADQTIWLGFTNFGICKISRNKTEVFSYKGNACTNDTANYFIVNLKGGDRIYTSIPNHAQININDPDVESIRTLKLATKLVSALSRNFSLACLQNGSVVISQHDNVAIVDSGNSVMQFHLSRDKDVAAARSLDGRSVWVLVQNSASLCLKPVGKSLLPVDSLAFTTAATDIIIDKQGNYWLSTLNAGVFMIPDYSIKIFDFKERGIDRRAFSFGQFNKKLYVGLAQNSYFVIDSAQKGSFYKGAPEPPDVRNFALDESGKVATNVDFSAPIRYYMNDVIEFGPHRLLGCGANGVIIIDHMKIIYKSENAGFNQRIARVTMISPGRYALSGNSGLFYFDTAGGYGFTAEPVLKNTRVTACKSLNRSVYAIATRGKGVFINIKNKFYPINISNGLKTDLNEDLYFENDSVLWIASYKGIAKVYFALSGKSLNLRVKCYTKEDGLCSDQINAITGYNGFIWLATNEGLCYFKPSDLREDICNIPIYFGNIYSNGNKLNSDRLELKYDEGNLLIEFHALYYKSVSGIRYKVRLKGRESWKYTGQSYVQYFNLPAGNYEFQVAAEDNFGKYSSPVIDLKFVIHPKFTDTIFFKLILIILALSIIAVILFQVFRYQRLKAANFINLLKAEFKALNYQINPHFIFNVLNSIQYYILRKESDKAVHFLNSFSLLIRRIVTNSRQQYISVIEEIECLKEYMDLEKLRLDNKFDYEINIDSRVDIEAKILVPMIIQPIVENSIWHGIVPSGFKGKVKIDFKLDDNALVIVVKDNGVGLRENGQNLNSSPQHLSMAMSNINERLKIIGDLNDSTWYIHMEDKKEKGLNETGAIVTIRFPEIKKN